jgi:hypothetical protein
VAKRRLHDECQISAAHACDRGQGRLVRAGEHLPSFVIYVSACIVATDFPVSLDMAATNFGPAERQTLSFGTNLPGPYRVNRIGSRAHWGGDDE